MKMRQRAALWAVALAGALASCGSDMNGTGDRKAAEQGNASAVGAEAPAELPPMVLRSASYRCDDGDALYVDVLTGEDAVSVRDSRADVPTRLVRENGSGPFAGEGRTLSGIGEEVQYSAPNRPEQECRAAAV